MMQAYMLPRHATCSIFIKTFMCKQISRFNMKSVQAFIFMARAVSCSQPTLPMGSGDIIASVPMKLSLYGALSFRPIQLERVVRVGLYSSLPCYVLFAFHCCLPCLSCRWEPKCKRKGLNLFKSNPLVANYLQIQK